MSWESDFNSQWQTFLDIVETQIRREIKNTGEFNSTFVDVVIQREIEKWSQSNHFNGAWLNKLNREFPSLGEKFRLKLDDLKLIQYENKIIYSHKLIRDIFLIVIFFVLLYFSVEFIPVIEISLIRQVLLTILVSMTILPILKLRENRQGENKVDQLIKSIKKKLDNTGNELRNIAVEADKSR